MLLLLGDKSPPLSVLDHSHILNKVRDEMLVLMSAEAGGGGSTFNQTGSGLLQCQFYLYENCYSWVPGKRLNQNCDGKFTTF